MASAGMPHSRCNRQAPSLRRHAPLARSQRTSQPLAGLGRIDQRCEEGFAIPIRQRQRFAFVLLHLLRSILCCGNAGPAVRKHSGRIANKRVVQG
jgi:hypothetical protein